MRTKFGLVLCLFACAGLMTGCAGLAKQLGVKAKTKKIALKDLGGAYGKMSCTKYDIFTGGKKRSKKCKKPKKMSNVSYKAFGLKSLDDFNRQANVVYAQYVFASKTLDTSRKELKKLTGKDALKVGVNDIGRALSKGLKKTKSKKRFDNAKTGVKLSLKGLNGIVSQATKMQGAGSKMVSKIPGEMAKDAKRAVLADQAVAELKSSISKLAKVVKGGPKLIKKMTKMKSILF